MESVKPSYRIKVRLIRMDGQPECRFEWEVFAVNGEWLSTPVRLNDWLGERGGEMANLVVEPV